MVLRSHIHDQLAIPLQTIFSQPLSVTRQDKDCVYLSGLDVSHGSARAIMQYSRWVPYGVSAWKAYQ